MARKPKKIPVEVDDSPEGVKKRDAKSVLDEARENFKLDIEADEPNRHLYRESMKFCYEPGSQWEDKVKQARGKKRITREFNETRVKVKSIVNHIRANRPAAKINPVEEGDVDTAEAMNGIWLNILNTSNADDITDFAAETQVAAGMGAWMVTTDYCDGSVDEQDIHLRPIRNPLCLVPDRNAREQDKSDAHHWNLYTNYPKDAYEARFGSVDKIASFEAEDMNTDNDPAHDDDSVWLTEYWRKEPKTVTLCKLVTGETVDKATLAQGQEVAIVAGKPLERTFKSHLIVQYILSANEVLERNEWAGSEFPFVVVYGEYVIIDGQTRWMGLTPSMMDAQRSHNETLSGVFETIAMAPQSKYWATPEQAKGLMGQWDTSTEENLMVMLYNPDAKAPGPPPRVGGADVPAALMQASQMSRDSMKSVSGIFDASLGESSNETSGRAIRARTDQAQIVTYNFPDNIAKGIGRTCKIVLDLIPKIIDTQRSYRILGKDGAEKYVVVNRRDPLTGQIIENDLSRGKFDFVVSQGPNVQTQRQEAAETYTQLSQSNPNLQAVAGDIIFENLDLPGSKQIGERLKLMLPPPIQQLLNKDKPQDPAVIAAMAQIEQQTAQLQEQAALIEQAGQEAQTEKSAADKAKADVQVAAANLSTQEAQLATQAANLATQVAEFQKMVVETQLQFADQDAADLEAKTVAKGESEALDRDDMADGIAEALASMQQQSASQAQALASMMEQLAMQQAQPKPLMPKTAVSKRVNGKIVTELSDGRTAISEKVNGNMVTQISGSEVLQ